jgi:hypothetical protein
MCNCRKGITGYSQTLIFVISLDQPFLQRKVGSDERYERALFVQGVLK